MKKPTMKDIAEAVSDELARHMEFEQALATQDRNAPALYLAWQNAREYRKDICAV